MMTGAPTAGTTPMDLSKTVAFVLAGGEGSGLHELTQAHSKPSLHFGGLHRIVDFTMANAVSSGLDKMIVATQYQPDSLLRHLDTVWRPTFGDGSLVLGNGAQSASGKGYQGTADALRANIAALDAMGAQEVLILAADHIYQMDYRPMVAAHRASGAMVTAAALTLPWAEAPKSGTITLGSSGVITAFVDTPDAPAETADRPDQALVPMGVYVASWPWLRSQLLQASQMQDIDRDLLPYAIARGVAEAFIWQNGSAEAPYWRDIGNLESFRLASLDFLTRKTPCARPVVPGLTTKIAPDVTALRSRFVAQLNTGGMRILSPSVNADDPGRWAMLDRSVIMPGARVSPGVRLTNCIVAPATALPEGLVVGEDPVEDARWFRVTPEGTTLITTAMLARRALKRGTPFSLRQAAAAALGR